MADQDPPGDEPTDPAPESESTEPEAPPPASRDWLLAAAPEDAPADDPVPPEPEPESAPDPEPWAEPTLIEEPPPPPLPPEPPPPRPPPPPPRRPLKRRGGWFKRLVIAVFVVVFVIPLAVVAIYRLVPPPATPLMLIRLTQGKGLDYRWRPISRISPALVQAAVAAEDAHFCEHNGFDFAAMEKAMAANKRRPGKVRGGSTISQQVAKNVFLWPDRNYVRKGLEAYFTVLTETLWGKRRIMEMYLNVVEIGPGIYGAEAAAQRYFGTDAAHLTALQASRLVAVLPSPLRYKAGDPGPYVRKRSRRIGGAIGTVREDGLAACVGRLSGVAPRNLPAPIAPPSGPAPLPPPSPAGAPAVVDAALPPPEPGPVLDAPEQGVFDEGQTPEAPPPADAPDPQQAPELRDAQP